MLISLLVIKVLVVECWSLVAKLVEERRFIELILTRDIGAMTVFFLRTRIHQMVHPVVLELVFIGIKSFRLCDNFHFLVVVWSATISGNNSPLEICMHKVSTAVFLYSLGLLFMGTFFAFRNLGIV